MTMPAPCGPPAYRVLDARGAVISELPELEWAIEAAEIVGGRVIDRAGRQLWPAVSARASRRTRTRRRPRSRRRIAEILLHEALRLRGALVAVAAQIDEALARSRDPRAVLAHARETALQALRA